MSKDNSDILSKFGELIANNDLARDNLANALADKKVNLFPFTDDEPFIKPDMSVIGRPLPGYALPSEEITNLIQALVDSNTQLAKTAQEATIQAKTEHEENRKYQEKESHKTSISIFLMILTLLATVAIPFIIQMIF